MPNPVGASTLTQLKLPENLDDGYQTLTFKVKGYGFKKHTYRVSFNPTSNQFFVQRKNWFGSGWKEKVKVDFKEEGKHRTSRWLARTFIAQSNLLDEGQKAGVLKAANVQVANDIFASMPEECKQIPDDGYSERSTDSRVPQLSQTAERIKALMDTVGSQNAQSADSQSRGLRAGASNELLASNSESMAGKAAACSKRDPKIQNIIDQIPELGVYTDEQFFHCMSQFQELNTWVYRHDELSTQEKQLIPGYFLVLFPRVEEVVVEVHQPTLSEMLAKLKAKIPKLLTYPDSIINQALKSMDEEFRAELCSQAESQDQVESFYSSMLIEAAQELARNSIPVPNLATQQLTHQSSTASAVTHAPVSLYQNPYDERDETQLHGKTELKSAPDFESDFGVFDVNNVPERIVKAHEVIEDDFMCLRDTVTLNENGFWTEKLAGEILTLARNDEGNYTQESKQRITEIKAQAKAIVEEHGEDLGFIKREIQDKVRKDSRIKGKEQWLEDVEDGKYKKRPILWRYHNADAQYKSYIINGIVDEVVKQYENSRVYFSEEMKKNIRMTDEQAKFICNTSQYQKIYQELANFVDPTGQKVNLHELMEPIKFTELIKHVDAKRFVEELPLTFCERIYAFVILKSCAAVISEKSKLKGIVDLEVSDCFSMLNNNLVMPADYNSLNNELVGSACQEMNNFGEVSLSSAHVNQTAIIRILQHRAQQKWQMLPTDPLEYVCHYLRHYRGGDLLKDIEARLGKPISKWIYQVDASLLTPENIAQFCESILFFIRVDNLMSKLPQLRIDFGNYCFGIKQLQSIIGSEFVTRENWIILSQFEELVKTYEQSGYNVDQALEGLYAINTEQYERLEPNDKSEVDKVWKLRNLLRSINQNQLPFSQSQLPPLQFAFSSWQGNCNFNTTMQFLIRTVPPRVVYEQCEKIYCEGGNNGHWKNDIEEARYIAVEAFRALQQKHIKIKEGLLPPQFLSIEAYNFFEAVRWLVELKADKTTKLVQSAKVFDIGSMRQDDIPNILSGLYAILGFDENPNSGFQDIIVETSTYNGREVSRVVKARGAKEEYYFGKTCGTDHFDDKASTEDTQLSELIRFTESEGNKAATEKLWTPAELGLASLEGENVNLETVRKTAILVEDIHKFECVTFNFSFFTRTQRRHIEHAVVNHLKTGRPFEVPIVYPQRTGEGKTVYYYGTMNLDIQGMVLQRGDNGGHYFYATRQANRDFTYQDDTRDLTLPQLKVIKDEFKDCRNVTDVIMLNPQKNAQYTPALVSAKVMPNSNGKIFNWQSQLPLHMENV